jgi:hypothetical protein
MLIELGWGARTKQDLLEWHHRAWTVVSVFVNERRHPTQ